MATSPGRPTSRRYDDTVTRWRSRLRNIAAIRSWSRRHSNTSKRLPARRRICCRESRSSLASRPENVTSTTCGRVSTRRRRGGGVAPPPNVSSWRTSSVPPCRVLTVARTSSRFHPVRYVTTHALSSLLLRLCEYNTSSERPNVFVTLRRATGSRSVADRSVLSCSMRTVSRPNHRPTTPRYSLDTAEISCALASSPVTPLRSSSVRPVASSDARSPSLSGGSDVSRVVRSAGVPSSCIVTS